MLERKFDIQSMRVASPCSVGWETMTGNERVRHCDSCRLNIYNTAEMTTKEIETLVQNHEGRLCIRLYRRADGTVLTKDCPVGLRAVRKRITTFASACVATIFSFVTFSYGQDKDLKAAIPPPIAAEHNDNQKLDTYLSGTVTDANGAVIPGAKVELYEPRDAGKKKYKPIRMTRTDHEGKFFISALSESSYEIEVGVTGFKRTIVKNVKTSLVTPSQISISLEVNGDSVVVGIFSDVEPLIDMSKSSITTVIRGRKID